MLERLKRIFRSRRADAGGAEARVKEIPGPPRTEEGPSSAPAADVIRRADIDPDAIKIVGRLARHGHTAYLVGGCVRDLLLGRRPKDFDISTSATPRQIKGLFRNSRIIGRRFKLAHIFFRNAGPGGGEKIIEVSTFRALQEGPENPDDLLITRDNVFGTPEEDALRRDFTVNGLFYDVQQERVIDHAEGLPDLHRRLLRTIGDPDIRLREDPVRILRAIKFASRLGFQIEERTMEAMRQHRREISRSAPPRVLEELLRMLRSGASVSAFALLGESRVLEVLLPELDRALGSTPSSVEHEQGILSELDRRAAGGEMLETSVLLSAVFLPLIPWQANAAAGAPDLPAAMERIIDPVLERMRVSRRDSDRIRRILLSIRKMVPGYRAKRFSRQGLARRPYFPLLLQVFGIHCRASGTWERNLGEWLELARRIEPEPEEESGERRRRSRGPHGSKPRGRGAGGRASAGGGEAPGKRRRRRRRRRGGARPAAPQESP